jgi:hypothetical protein
MAGVVGCGLARSTRLGDLRLTHYPETVLGRFERVGPRDGTRLIASGLMRIGTARWEIASALVLFSMLFGCTGPPDATPSDSTSSQSVTFARYFFSALGTQGVLEVSSSPPSICYSTQSSPARPISIVPSGVMGPSPGVVNQAEVSYVPRTNDFCDRDVDPALAAALITHPSGYQVRWRPGPGAPTASSSFTPVGG